MPDARAEIRQGRLTMTEALCTGIGKDRQSSDQGQYESIDGLVRVVAADVPARMKLVNGELLDVKPSGGEWQTLRIGGRFEQAGVIRLSMEWPHE